MKLDLGCGEKPVEGHVGVDLPLPGATSPGAARESFQAYVDPSGIVRFDLASGIPWPFETGSFEGLHSSHLIEHLPAEFVDVYRWEQRDLGNYLAHLGTRDALCWFLQEAWRVTAVGGEFLLRWPALVDERTGRFCVEAFIDPTHRRFIPLRQLQNWSRSGRNALPAHHLGIDCNWTVRRTVQRERGGAIENEALLLREL